MSIRRKIRRARDRELITPGRDLRWYLYRAGRADGRRNIPDLANAGWLTPLLEEMRCEGNNGVRLFGEEFFRIIAPHNDAVARARQHVRFATTRLAEAEELAGQRRDNAASATEPASSASDPSALQRRAARQALVLAKETSQQVGTAQASLASALAARQDVADAHRERTWAFIGFVRAACAIYWAWNFRARRRSVAKRPEHVVMPNLDLPDWLTDSDWFKTFDQELTDAA